MLRLCRDDLNVCHIGQRCHVLYDATKQKRLNRSKQLILEDKNGMIQDLIFNDEKSFTVEAAFNHLNDRVLEDHFKVFLQA